MTKGQISATYKSSDYSLKDALQHFSEKHQIENKPSIKYHFMEGGKYIFLWLETE
jgi:capsule polysaccharide modification protein KpsS